MQSLWMGAALEEFFLFESLFFSKCEIRMLLFMCWLKSRPSMKVGVHAKYGEGEQERKEKGS